MSSTVAQREGLDDVGRAVEDALSRATFNDVIIKAPTLLRAEAGGNNPPAFAPLAESPFVSGAKQILGIPEDMEVNLDFFAMLKGKLIVAETWAQITSQKDYQAAFNALAKPEVINAMLKVDARDSGLFQALKELAMMNA